MRREDARVHAAVWLGVSQKMLPHASMDNDTAKLHRVFARLANEVGQSYAAVSEDRHPATGEPWGDR